MISKAAIAAAALVFGVSGADAQQLTPNYKVVEHGRTLKIGLYGSYDPDCRSLGPAIINLIAAPQGGQVQTAAGRDYPSFLSNNVRFHCDSRKLPGTILYYQASPTFVGTDSFTIEVVFANGEAHQTRYTVYVR